MLLIVIYSIVTILAIGGTIHYHYKNRGKKKYRKVLHRPALTPGVEVSLSPNSEPFTGIASTILSGLLAIFLVGGAFCSFSKSNTPQTRENTQEVCGEKWRNEYRKNGGKQVPIDSTKTESPVKSRQDRIQSLFSSWDGSLPSLVSKVKYCLNDSGSFQHDSTRYDDHGDCLVVGMRYRAKNGFGAYVIGYAIAKVDLNGAIINMISE